MGENSSIEWTDHTFNPWIGCTKVSPGCDHCYAEGFAERFKMVEWGPGKPRKLTSDANWKQPLKWNHEAMMTGIRRRVFCASLADVFDNEVDPQWRARLWNLVSSTQHLDWLLLTKRVGNVPKMLPPDWGNGWPTVWLGISVVNQEEADRDIPKLLAVPARIRFLSMEPLLGPVDLARPLNLMFHVTTPFCAETGRIGQSESGWRPSYKVGDPNETPIPSDIDWVIVGGESGHHARPMQLEWATSLRDQCVAAGVPFFFKQFGEWAPYEGLLSQAPPHHGVHVWENNGTRSLMSLHVGKKRAGRLLEGREWNEFPVMSAA